MALDGIRCHTIYKYTQQYVVYAVIDWSKVQENYVMVFINISSFRKKETNIHYSIDIKVAQRDWRPRLAAFATSDWWRWWCRWLRTLSARRNCRSVGSRCSHLGRGRPSARGWPRHGPAPRTGRSATAPHPVGWRSHCRMLKFQMHL